MGRGELARPYASRRVERRDCEQFTPNPWVGLAECTVPGGAMGSNGENSRTKLQNVVTHSRAMNLDKEVFPNYDMVWDRRISFSKHG